MPSVKTRLGLSDSDVRKILSSYSKTCPLCEYSRATCIDHDHVTSRIRGVLCVWCNVRLYYAENVEWLSRAQQYSKTHIDLELLKNIVHEELEYWSTNAVVDDQSYVSVCASCDHEFCPTRRMKCRQLYCKICCPDRVWVRRINRYGVSKPMWDAIKFSQEDVCALCDSDPCDVDHCHRTGQIRGLLCKKCNTGMITAEDESFINRASLYLNN